MTKLPSKIAIASDHAGFECKEKLSSVLKSKGIEVKDFGTYSAESTDYPDYAHPLADAIEKGEFEKGIIICSSGNGMAITANKHKGVRAALCWNEQLAALARQHNNANVLSIPASFIPFETAEKMTEIFLAEEFEGGRHARRVDKISNC